MRALGSFLVVTTLLPQAQPFPVLKASPYYSEGYDQFTFPDPSKDYVKCRRPEMSTVCDPDGILTPTALDKLEHVIHSVRQDTHVWCPTINSGNGEIIEVDDGYQVGIAIMESISPRVDAEDLAIDIYDNWGLGTEGCGNGVLILLSVADREIQVASGGQATHILSDRITKLIEDIKPTLKESLYENALLALVMNIGICLALHASSSSSSLIVPKNKLSGGGNNQQSMEKRLFSFSKNHLLILTLATVALIGGGIYAVQQHQYHSRIQQSSQQLQRYLDSKRRGSRQYPQHHLPWKRPQNSPRPVAAIPYNYECPLCTQDYDIHVFPNGTQALDRKDFVEYDEDANSCCCCFGDSPRTQSRLPCLGRRRGFEKHSVKLRCGHRFCVECVAEYLYRFDKCPLCYKNAPEYRELRQLHGRKNHRCKSSSTEKVQSSSSWRNLLFDGFAAFFTTAAVATKHRHPISTGSSSTNHKDESKKKKNSWWWLTPSSWGLDHHHHHHHQSTHYMLPPRPRQRYHSMVMDEVLLGKLLDFCIVEEISLADAFREMEVLKRRYAEEELRKKKESQLRAFINDILSTNIRNNDHSDEREHQRNSHQIRQPSPQESLILKEDLENIEDTFMRHFPSYKSHGPELGSRDCRGNKLSQNQRRNKTSSSIRRRRRRLRAPFDERELGIGSAAEFDENGKSTGTTW